MKAVDEFLKESTQLTIFQDLDGCLTDFEGAVEDFGYGTFDEIEAKHGEAFVWKLVNGAGEKFWSELKWMKDGKKLWDVIKHYNPTILSAPINTQASRTGKEIWVKRELGSHIKLILERARDKKNHATPGAILIDDREDTIADWRMMGGIGIHHKSAEDTIRQLKQLQ